MKRFYKKITSISVLVIGLLVIVVYTRYPSFLESSIVEASLWTREAIQNQIVQKQGEKLALLDEKEEKTQELSWIQLEYNTLKQKIQQVSEIVNNAQQELNGVNTQIAAIPWPDYSLIDQEYTKRVEQENTRYNTQKDSDQKKSLDAINLSQKLYEDIATRDKAIAMREVALQELTTNNLWNLTQHEEALITLKESQDEQRAGKLLENQAILTPLLQKKNDITERKIQKQSEQSELMRKGNLLENEIAKVTLQLEELDTLIASIDKEIITLQWNLSTQQSL